MNRTDIAMKDVFISWTGKDRELKDRIVEFLNSNHISCLESDESCSGDYRQWSKQAVGACSVFLLILTENTLKSQYVPIEIEELKKLDDWENRVVPVCMNMDLYQNHSWGLHESESAVILEDQFPTQQRLAAIFHKTIDLLIHRQYAIYCCQNNKEYATLTPLLGANKTATKQYSYDSLYIPRSVTELDDQGQYIETIESPNELIKNDDILFISGPAGSGKTQYIHQIRNCADDNDLVISLSCAKTAQSSEDLLSCIFHEFERIAGIRTFYSVDNFKRLINVKHLVLILDGMDEIATQAGTKKFVSKVDEFYASNAKNVALIFTSRNSDDANTIALGGKTLRRFTLNKLTDSEISKLSENLFLLFGSIERNREFYIKLNDLDEEIKSNPLLLSQLAIVYQNTGEIPQSVIGIYDAVSKITFSTDLSAEFDSVPATYKEMLELELSSILKSFSQERYKLLSQGKNIEITKIFSKILKEKYAGESKARAEFLVEYLQNRSILIDGEFYHKMFLEYFTAVAYYEQAFDDYDEIENVDILNELFAHYDDAYWSAVIKLFLVKADSCIDENTTEDLYDSILKHNKICEYTLLFDACRDLIRHKEQAQVGLVCDILCKSIDGTYPPYGPLFWYVPEYELYETAVLAAEKLSGNARALALVRDVCFIFGRKYTVADTTDAVDGEKLYQAAKSMLSGVRDGLVELFCIGSTECTLGTDIYPRCFNIAEAKHFMEIGHGMFGRMSSMFEDELDLWGESYPELNGEYIGFVSCLYDKAEMERKLCEKPTVKVRGLALINTDDTVMDYVHFVRTSVRVLYVPENIQAFQKEYDLFMHIDIPFRFTGRKFDCEEDYTPLDYIDCPVKYAVDMLVYMPFDIREAIVPEKVRIIGGGLFAGHQFLEEVLLSRGLIEIAGSAFKGCANLKSIMIPDSVTKIGKSAFQGCVCLSSITIPDSVTKIDEFAFSGCISLSSIIVSDSVWKIGGHAFENCTSLSNFTIPNSVRTIGVNLFSGCVCLSSIAIHDAVVEIGTGAFMGCISLNSITIPNSVKIIGGYAFDGCAGLKDIIVSEFVTKMGWCVFRGCTAISSFIIPSSVTKIEDSSFEGCASLSNIIIPESVTKIGDSAFKGCVGLSNIIIPETVTELGRDVFKGCTTLSNITISTFVKKINNGAFKGCTSLKRIIIPDSVTEIGRSAFEGCKNLRDIIIPDFVVEIGKAAFEGCEKLKRISMPSSLKLKTFDFPSSAEIIYREGTDLCNASLAEMTLEIGRTEILEKEFSHSTIGKIYLPHTLERIGNFAFESCVILSSITIPNSVTAIGKSAFQRCVNLRSITISGSVTEISESTFKACTSLANIVIPNCVTKIGNAAFSGCRNLSSITMSNSITEIGWESFQDCKKLSGLIIPDSVIHIRPHAFYNCESLNSINIPDSVKTIGAGAFRGCTSLMSVTFSNSVTKLSLSLFKDCISLVTITIPNTVMEIEPSAFEGCTSLSSIIIPDSVTKIGWKAFHCCTSLGNITIPNSVTEIGHSAFEGCTSLKSIIISNSVTAIADSAFADCACLGKIIIPEAVKEVGDEAFLNCVSLTTLDIPKSVRHIGDRAFAGCSGLTSVTLSANFKNDVARIFGDIDPSIIHWIE